MTRIPSAPLTVIPAAGTQPAAAAVPPSSSPAPAAAPTAAPDGVKTTAPPASDVPAVATALAATAPVALTASELNTLLKNPQGLATFGRVLQRSPELKAALKALPEGDAAIAALEKAATGRTSKADIQKVQSFLAAAGKNIRYAGHPTGIDGIVGSRTQAALKSLMLDHLPKPVAATPPTPPTAPVADVAPSPLKVADIDARLGETRQPLNAFAAVIKQDPRLREVLSATPRGAAALAALEGPPTSAKIRAVQEFLVKDHGKDLAYRGHATGIDGDYGTRTYAALRDVVRAQVATLNGETAAPREPFPRYDRMFDDNLLDMTLAVGYDEGIQGYQGANLYEEYMVRQKITAQGFVRDDAKAKALLEKAGQNVAGSYDSFYVKENVSTANGEPVHAVIRLITSGDGQRGAANKAAALEGMNQSDVFMYGGHARYGTGLDFDANYAVTVDWTGVPNAPAEGKVRYNQYDTLKKLLGGTDAAAIQRLEQLKKQGKVTVHESNDGNIFMSEKNQHPYEFGSQLMEAATAGRTNTLAEDIQGDKYRLWLFNGCRTEDYAASLQAAAKKNPALNEQNLDLVLSNESLYWNDISTSLSTFLEGIVAQDSAVGLEHRLESVNIEAGKNSHNFRGLQDNPRSNPVKP
jgi:hypothetical protein